MSSQIIFLTVAALFGLASGQVVNCTFEQTATDYVCYLFDQNIQTEMDMIDIAGDHLPDRSNMDVTALISWDGSVVKVFPSIVIVRFINLRHVFVQHAGMTTFQSAVGHCPQLTSVLIGSNQLTLLPARIFQDCSRLTILSLAMNSLSVIDPNAFSGLVNLNSLILMNNQIQILPPNVFAPLVSLETLFLSSNHIADLSGGLFNALTNLVELHLDDNDMSSWNGQILANNPIIARLSIARNKLESLVADSFDNLNSLANLTLAGNQLQTLPVFNALPNLENLNLNENRLTSVNGDWFRNMPRLQMLEINRNLISDVDFVMRAGRVQLPVRFLRLMSNKIENLQDNAFTMLSNLEQLDLFNNQIQRLNALSIRPITQMRRLTVDNNRISRIERELFNGTSSFFFWARSNVCVNRDFVINHPSDFDYHVAPLMKDCFGTAASSKASVVAVITAVLLIIKM